MARARRTLAAALLLAPIALTGGCWYVNDGIPTSSRDEYNYPSTATMPQTVVLRDLRTDEVLHTWEVPVDSKLFVRFLSDQNLRAAGDPYPDTCEWVYYPVGTWNPPLSDRLRFQVPAASSRRLELSVRTSPELPAAMRPADVPKPQGELPPLK